MRYRLFALLLLAFAPYLAQAEDKPLQTQDGPNGTTLDLVKADVKGDVLTIAIRYSCPENCNLMFSTDVPTDEIYYTASGKKYPLLKDAEDNWLAANVKEYSNKKGKFYIETPTMYLKGKTAIRWFKFPAPPAGVNDISFQFGKEMIPFDITLQR